MIASRPTKLLFIFIQFICIIIVIKFFTFYIVATNRPQFNLNFIFFIKIIYYLNQKLLKYKKINLKKKKKKKIMNSEKPSLQP